MFLDASFPRYRNMKRITKFVFVSQTCLAFAYFMHFAISFFKLSFSFTSLISLQICSGNTKVRARCLEMNFSACKKIARHKKRKRGLQKKNVYDSLDHKESWFHRYCRKTSLAQFSAMSSKLWRKKMKCGSGQRAQLEFCLATQR